MRSMLTRIAVIGAFLLFIILFPGHLKGEAETSALPSSAELSFIDVYQNVLGYYPRLKSQHAKVDEAIASKYEAYAALLPTVQGLASVTHSDDPVAVFGSLLRQESFTANNFELHNLNQPSGRTNYNYTLQGEMPLFNAFQTMARIRSSKSLAKAAQYQQEFTEMEAALLGFEGYLKELLTGENLLRTASSEEAGLNDLKQAEDLKNKGMVLGADFYGAKMIFSEIRQIHQQMTAHQKTAQILLNILMGNEPENEHDLKGKFPAKPHGAETLDVWMAKAFQFRPDLKAFQEKVEAQKAETFREKMSALPRVGAFANLTEDTHDLSTGGENYSMGFQGKMDFIDAGYWARRKKAKASYQAIQAEYQSFKDQVAKDVSQAVNGLEALSANMPLAEEAYHDGEEAVKQTEVLYREGRKSILDLLEMRRAFLLTALRRNEILFQSEMAYANLLFLTGQMKEPAVLELAEKIDGAK